MKKNAASQVVGAQMVSATDGSAFTGSVTVAVTVDGGTQATGSVGSGACTHEGGGYHTYAPAQAETNGDLVAFTFSGTGAVPVTVQVYTLPTTGILAPTTAGRTLDVAATGEAGVDLDNIKQATGATTLTNITVPTVTNLTNAPTAGDLTAAMKASVNAEVDTAISDAALASAADLATVAGYLDTEIAAIKATTDKLDDTLEDDAGTFRFTTNSLEQAPTGGSAPTASEIADAVWDEDLTGHTTADTAGEILGNVATGTPPTAAAIADAVWDEATAGHTTSGTFGEQLKTDVDAILADTAEIGAAGAGLTAADDAILTAIAALNDLSSADVQSAASAAITAYDPPTNAEMEARTLAAASYATAASLATVDTVADAIKAKTDQFVFTTAGQVDATAITVSDKTGYSLSNTGIDALFTRQLTEAYNADGTAPTVAQSLFVIMQGLTEKAIAGTTVTVKKLDGSTTAYTLTLDDATTPTSSTRAS